MTDGDGGGAGGGRILWTGEAVQGLVALLVSEVVGGGAGIVVVGDPGQCAATLQEFIDLGCTSFCLSGYLHDEEATRFARWVRPLLAERNSGRMLAA